MYQCTGVILAGGENKRLPGIHKGFIEVSGVRIIDHILTLFNKLFDEIIIVTNTPHLYTDVDAIVVSDIIKVRSSLAGIHAGLFYSSNPNIFVSACDTPFLSEDLVVKVLKSMDPSKTVIVPEVKLGLEPLCAVYSKKCISHIERNIKEGRLSIRSFFTKNRTKKIPESVLRKEDKDLRSFFNINTEEDLKTAREIAEGIKV
ncbi:MAG: molybdenum cofactor guanylyltransferase [Desulfobacterales bacterium]|nr:molybdenum cofactor guanylyltransferase [Desulfobacterales bacterium]MCP4162289.1 molybdenum cofactor guanylyltransferase [Deltaproteobacteria bacterium]